MFCDKCFTISVFLQSLQWILFSCGFTIEPCLKFYAVPSQSQCMTLSSRSQTLNFFCVKSLQCQLLQSLWLIWIMFGMNGYKILKCFRKEKRISGELPCLATGLIDYFSHLCKISYSKMHWCGRQTSHLGYFSNLIVVTCCYLHEASYKIWNGKPIMKALNARNPLNNILLYWRLFYSGTS